MHQSKIWQGPACLLRMLTCSYTRPEWQWFEGVVGFQLTTLFAPSARRRWSLVQRRLAGTSLGVIRHGLSLIHLSLRVLSGRGFLGTKFLFTRLLL